MPVLKIYWQWMKNWNELVKRSMKLNMLEVRANLNKNTTYQLNISFVIPVKHSSFLHLRILLYHNSCIDSSQQNALHQHHTTPTKTPTHHAYLINKILDNFIIKMAITLSMLLILIHFIIVNNKYHFAIFTHSQSDKQHWLCCGWLKDLEFF